MASVVLNNKKGLVKLVNSKRRPKENTGSILIEDGPLTNRNTEKLEVFSGVFFSLQPLIILVRPQGWRTTTAGTVTLHLCTEIVRGQLYHLTVHKIMRPGEIHPRVLQELLDVTAGPHSKVMGVWGRLCWPPQAGELASHCNLERCEERHRKLQICESNLSTWKNCGEYTTGHERHFKETQASGPAWVHKGKPCLTDLRCFYN